MKNAFFFITVILIAFSSYAQGRLQFNQVVTITADTSFYYSGSGASYEFDLYEVPENSVVKVVKALNYKTSTGSNSCNTNDFLYTINGIITSGISISWLKSGDIIGAYAYLRGPDSGDICRQYDDMFISLIEYNIIPE